MILTLCGCGVALRVPVRGPVPKRCPGCRDQHDRERRSSPGPAVWSAVANALEALAEASTTELARHLRGKWSERWVHLALQGMEAAGLVGRDEVPRAHREPRRWRLA